MHNDLRQCFHLEPRKGWLNDPNGLCFFKGEYHVYFQYSPDSAQGKGRKCWGHFKSPDLISWTFTGTVLFPDISEDRSGVYSGSGFVKDDTLYLFYTGNVKEEGDHDYIRTGRGANVIMVTTENGHDMSGKKILLRNADYPDYCSCHVRDPKVWEEDGRYWMVLGARTLEDKGCVLFYSSDDLESWRFDRAEDIPDFGYMWECPDVLRLGDERFLSLSPQGVPHERTKFQNVYSAGYMRYDGGLTDYREWDCGFDFYAPQTFTAPDERTILIGWMGIGDIPYYNATTELGWQHCLTVPRELTLSGDGGVCQRPVRELEALMQEPADVSDGENRAFGLPFRFRSGDISDGFTLSFGDMLVLEQRDGILSLRFTSDKAGCGRDERLADIRVADMDILADKSSLEIYLNGGSTVMSTRFYPEDTDLTLSFRGISGKIYPMKEMEVGADE